MALIQPVSRLRCRDAEQQGKDERDPAGLPSAGPEHFPDKQDIDEGQPKSNSGLTEEVGELDEPDPVEVGGDGEVEAQFQAVDDPLGERGEGAAER